MWHPLYPCNQDHLHIIDNCGWQQTWADIPMVTFNMWLMFATLTGGQTCNVNITHNQARAQYDTIDQWKVLPWFGVDLYLLIVLMHENICLSMHWLKFQKIFFCRRNNDTCPYIQNTFAVEKDWENVKLSCKRSTWPAYNEM